MRLDLFAAM